MKFGVYDPSARIVPWLSAVAADCVKQANPIEGSVDALLTAAAVAREVTNATAPIWIVGEGKASDKLASAAVQSQARGVLLAPVNHVPTAPTLSDLATCTRALVALSIVDGNIEGTLQQLADAFGADNAVIWWRRGDEMTPTSLVPLNDDTSATLASPTLLVAVRIAAGANASVVVPGGPTLAAAPLYSASHEMMGFVAVLHAQHFFPRAACADLRAFATRLGREMVWLAGHDRLLEDRENLRANSLMDPLTSALSRTGFEQTIAAEITGARRRGEKLSIGVLDVVGLAEINASHGHKIGDEVLTRITAQLRGSLRGNDRIGRLGGDELGILLVGAKEDQAKQVCEKLLRRITDAPLIARLPELRVQVRLGVAEVGPDDKSAESTIDRAWSALCAAKSGSVEAARDHGDKAAPRSDGRVLESGTIVGGTFRVLHELSRGAMGVVYRGEDLGLGRPVAIKVLRANLATDLSFVSRFRAEAALLASLHHANLVQVYSLGEQDGEVYFVMELVEGQPLSSAIADHLHNKAKFPLDAAGQIAIEIADALAAMHAIGVVHRDVKPANVLLDRNRDRAVLVDVGVAAKRGENSEAAGTPGFAAPEAFLSSSDSPLVDVYGLAATVYCMLSGEPPFGAGAPIEVIRRQMEQPLVPIATQRPEVPPAVDAVLAKALDPDPTRRWQSATTFAMAFSRALESSRRSGTDGGDDAPEVEWLEAPDPGGATSAGDHVRALHFTAAMHIIRHVGGEAALVRLQTDAPTLVPRLSSAANGLEWAPVGDLLRVLGYLVKLAPEDALIESLGREVTQSNLAMFLGQDPRGLSPELLLTAVMPIWPKLHHWCDLRLLTVERGKAELELHTRNGHAHLCELIVGELAGALVFAAPATVTHPACRHRGDAACRFAVTW